MDISISRKLWWSRAGLISLSLLLIMFVIDFPVRDIPVNLFVGKAEAVIGRPATPGSVGGVRRRTRRRTRRRWALGTRLYTLPASCAKVTINGVVYYDCGGEYLRPSYEGTKVVYVVVEEP